MNDEGGSGGWNGNCYRRRTSALKVGHRTHLNRAILAGHTAPLPFFSCFFVFGFWCTRTLVHTDGHRFPVIVVHIYTLAGQDGPRSLVIVKIVIPCCRPSPGDLLCKTNTWHAPKCLLVFVFVFFFIEWPKSSTCVDLFSKTNDRSFHSFDPSPTCLQFATLFCLFSVFNCVIGKRISHFLRREEVRLM